MFVAKIYPFRFIFRFSDIDTSITGMWENLKFALTWKFSDIFSLLLYIYEFALIMEEIYNFVFLFVASFRKPIHFIDWSGVLSKMSDTQPFWILTLTVYRLSCFIDLSQISYEGYLLSLVYVPEESH